MKNRRNCIAAAVLLGGGLFLLLLACIYYFFAMAPAMLEKKRVIMRPPTILVRSPLAGDTIPADKSLLAEAFVTGTNPIARVEVWLDGVAAGTQSPGAPGQTTFSPSFDLQITAGTHMLFWRAVDNAGLVGQTTPIPIAGEIAAAEQATTAQTPAVPGQGGEGQAGEGTGGQTPAQPPQNAPSPPLPEPPGGTAKLLPANMLSVDLGKYLPALLSHLPVPPSHLQAGFQPCTIRLIWKDNATNEERFDVWMQALGGPPLKIRTTQRNPGTGETWFELDSPSFGIYSFWVEAANGLGSQPSEIAWVSVNNTSCGEGIATSLEIEGLGMRVTGGWRDIYCYLSLEKVPEKRIPEGKLFFAMDPTGTTDIFKWIGGKNRMLIKMPIDEEVALAGDCWGWLGATPASMGIFSASVPKEQWDNRTLHISTPSYLIDYRIRPFGSTRAEGAFTYLDYGIPRPERVSAEVRTSKDPVQNADYARTPVVRWTWNGENSDITGFVVYAEGAMVAWIADPAARQTTLMLPSTCGGTYEIQVAAQSDLARSPFSESVIFPQSPCPVMAEVRFLTARSNTTNDTSCAFPDISSCFPYSPCDEIGVYYRLWAVNSIRKEIRVGTTNLPLPYRCKIDYEFTNQLAAQTATILIPIDPSVTELRIGTEFWESDETPGGDDRFGVTVAKLSYTYDQWPSVDQDVTLTAPYMDGTADLTVKAHVRGYYYQVP